MPRIWDEGDQNRVRKQLRESLLYYLIISMGSLVAIVFLLKPTVNLFLSKDLSHIVNFEGLVLVIGLGIIGLGTSRFFNQLVKYKEQNYLQLFFRLISVILNMGLNYFLIQKWGIIGAGIATCISYLVIVIMCNYYLDMNLDGHFLTVLFRTILAGLFMVFWFYSRGVNNFFDLTFNMGIGVILYMFLIFLFRVVRFKDLRRRFT